MNKKWFAPILPYLAVWVGLFLFKSAWLALIGFHIAILLVLTLMRPAIPTYILFKSNHPKWILTAILFYSLGGIGLYYLWPLFGITNELPVQLQSIGLTSSSWPFFIAYFSVVNPFFEEYFWRAVLGSHSKNFYIGDIAYAGYHALVLWGRVHPLSILFAVFILTCAGWLWRQVAREDGGLLVPVLGHMIADLTILLIVYWKSML